VVIVRTASLTFSNSTFCTHSSEGEVFTARYGLNVYTQLVSVCSPTTSACILCSPTTSACILCSPTTSACILCRPALSPARALHDCDAEQRAVIGPKRGSTARPTVSRKLTWPDLVSRSQTSSSNATQPSPSQATFRSSTCRRTVP